MHRGTQRASVCPAPCRGRGQLHHRTHLRLRGRTGFRDGRPHDAPKFLVGQRLGQEFREDGQFQALFARKVGAPAFLEPGNGVVALLRLLADHRLGVRIGEHGVGPAFLNRSIFQRGLEHAEHGGSQRVTREHRGLELGFHFLQNGHPQSLTATHPGANDFPAADTLTEGVSAIQLAKHGAMVCAMVCARFGFESGLRLVPIAGVRSPPDAFRHPLFGWLARMIPLVVGLASHADAAPAFRPGQNLLTQEPDVQGASPATDPKGDRNRPVFITERLGAIPVWRITIPPPGATTGLVVRIPGASLPLIQPKQLIRISALARGKLRATAEARGITLGIHIDLVGDHRNHGRELRVAARPGRGGSGTFAGDFEWMPVEAVFALPAHTLGIEARFFSDQVHGQLEWKQFRIELVTAGRSTVEAPAALGTLQELGATLAQERDVRAVALRDRLAIPPPEQLYLPGPLLESAQPRLYFAGRPISEWAARWKDADHAGIMRAISDQALRLASQSADARLADGAMAAQLARSTGHFPLLALALLGAPEEGVRTAASNALEQLAPHTVSDPPSGDHGAQSTELFNLAVAYDWLRASGSPTVLAPLRIRVIELARHLRSPLNASAARARTGPARLDPEVLADYTALAAAAVALWNDTGAPIEAGEPKAWMDEAVSWFSVVWRALPTDGVPMEGFQAQDETLVPLIDFATLLETVCQPASRPLDHPAFVRLAAARAAALLPDQSGYVRFGAPARSPEQNSTTAQLRLLASRNSDPLAQGLANLSTAPRVLTAPTAPATAHRSKEERKDSKHSGERLPEWRLLFWGDPAFPGSIESPTHADFPELGFSTVRGVTPGGVPILFALKCGPPHGTTGASLGDDFADVRVDPDAGSFSLWRGSLAVIEGVPGAIPTGSSSFPLPLILPAGNDPEVRPTG